LAITFSGLVRLKGNCDRQERWSAGHSTTTVAPNFEGPLVLTPIEK